MTKTNAANERIKREYFRYLAEARGRDEATIDAVAKSLARFEDSTRGRDFKRFHREQAMAFKAKLAGSLNARSGEKLSKATVLATHAAPARVLRLAGARAWVQAAHRLR